MNKIFLTVMVLFLLSCKKENMGDCFKGKGKTVTESRSIGSFKAIELRDRINLHLNYSTTATPDLKVKAGENLQGLIVTEVKGNTLFIKNSNKCNWVRSFKNEIDVYLNVQQLKDFTYYGSGEVNFNNTLETDSFRLEMWEASGNLILDIKADYISLKSNTGPADVVAKGECREFISYMNGLGTIDAKNVQSEKALAVNRNKGKLIINVSNELTADISGSGDIECYGSPSTIDLKKSGSGSLIQR